MESGGAMGSRSRANRTSTEGRRSKARANAASESGARSPGTFREGRCVRANTAAGSFEKMSARRPPARSQAASDEVRQSSLA